MIDPIYLDYAATTPVDARVASFMHEVLLRGLGNATANHASGRAAAALIATARAQVARLAGAQPEDVVFTSGATEANNLAIDGTVRAARALRREVHVVTLATEHKSVLEPVRALQRAGVATTILVPGRDGRLSTGVLASALRDETCLVCLLHVNNETGVVQDIPALKAICERRAIPLHVDASQSAGKLPIDLDADLTTFTAHKLGGPQGIGALVIAPRHRGRIEPVIRGGGQERGLRAGTPAAHQIAGFGLACELAEAARATETQRLSELRERLWLGLERLPGAMRNGEAAHAAPHILNVTFAGVEGESLFRGLSQLTLSTGSACNSRSAEPSYVLRGMGRSTAEAQASLRFSFGRGTTADQIDAAIAAVKAQHRRLWENSPARPPPVFADGPCGVRYLGEAGEERLGTWVRLALQVEGGFVKDARAQVYGCPETLAACRHLCQGLLGRPITDPRPGTPEQWRQAVSAPVEKLGRMLIIEDAVGALAPA